MEAKDSDDTLPHLPSNRYWRADTCRILPELKEIILSCRVGSQSGIAKHDVPPGILVVAAELPFALLEHISSLLLFTPDSELLAKHRYDL